MNDGASALRGTVTVIQGDLGEAQLKALYRQCDALVAPSFAEGFGLPLAEAMLSGLPVITTKWSGQMGFCTDDNAWLVDYTFVPAKSHLNLPGSIWAVPKLEAFTLSSFGYFLPHKGLLERIDVVALLRREGIQVQLLNAEYPRPQSRTLIAEARRKVRNLGLDEWVNKVYFGNTPHQKALCWFYTEEEI